MGGGPAALLAARAVREARPDASIVVVEPGRPDRDQRTFATWTRGPSPFDDVFEVVWDRLFVFGPSGRTVMDLGDMRYGMFSMGRWREARQAELEALGVRFVRDRVERIEEDGSVAHLHLDDGELQARLVLDSRPPPIPEGTLWQFFHGWWVTTPHLAFDTMAPTFMDLQHPIDGALRFWYRLPMSLTRALVMAVTVAEAPIEAQLDPFLAAYGLRDIQILREERGRLPMLPGPWERRTGDRQLRIGLAGGRLKASTGYGLNRMVADARAIGDSVARHGHPFDLPQERPREHWMDAVFLRALREVPEEAPAWFESLARDVPAPRLLRFLDGEASLLDLAAVASALPLSRFRHWM